MYIQITLKLARVAPRKCRLLVLMATLTVVTLRVLLVVVAGVVLPTDSGLLDVAKLVAPRKWRLLMLMATLTVVTLRVLLVVVEGGVVADVGEAAWLV
jgi:hypothetical protein